MFDQGLKLLGFGKGDQVARNEKLVVHAGGGELDFGIAPVAAKDDSNRRVVARSHDAVFEVIEVKIHLAGVAMFEGAHLKVEQEVEAQDAMVEHQVNVVVFVVQ